MDEPDEGWSIADKAGGLNADTCQLPAATCHLLKLIESCLKSSVSLSQLAFLAKYLKQPFAPENWLSFQFIYRIAAILLEFNVLT